MNSSKSKSKWCLLKHVLNLLFTIYSTFPETPCISHEFFPFLLLRRMSVTAATNMTDCGFTFGRKLRSHHALPHFPLFSPHTDTHTNIHRLKWQVSDEWGLTQIEANVQWLQQLSPPQNVHTHAHTQSLHCWKKIGLNLGWKDFIKNLVVFIF